MPTRPSATTPPSWTPSARAASKHTWSVDGTFDDRAQPTLKVTRSTISTVSWFNHWTMGVGASVWAMRCAIVFYLLALHLAAPLAHAATTAPTASARLRVVTTPIAPFVLPDTDPPVGFSIDVWDAVAAPDACRFHIASRRG